MFFANDFRLSSALAIEAISQSSARVVASAPVERARISREPQVMVKEQIGDRGSASRKPTGESDLPLTGIAAARNQTCG